MIGGVWLLVVAAMLMLCGLCSAALYVITPFTARDSASALQSNVILGSSAGFGFVLGAILLWQGVSLLRGGRSPQAARAFPPVAAWLLAFVGAILLGVAALTFQSVAVFAFPPWHFLAASLFPLALLAYAARRLGRSSGLRALIVSFSWGALAATTLALLLELFIALLMIAVIGLVITLLPNREVTIGELQRQLLRLQQTGDLSGFENLLSSPWVAAGVLVYFAVIVPPVEEALKALVVAFIDPERTQRSDALLWGMAAGAGFAVLENVFNASVELSVWAFLILMRVGAAIVHVANGANMGRGWYAARIEGRWSRLFLAYAVSVLFHAAWNATAIILSNSAVRNVPGSAIPIESTLISILLLLVLLGLGLGGLAWIVYSVRRAIGNHPEGSRLVNV